jgi:HTH-type transcriptional regulator / antitoxin HipB
VARSSRFSEFMRDLEEESAQEGPAAVAELQAWRDHFELAGELARRRKALGLSQTQLARRAGIRQSDVSRLESGSTNPTWSTLQAVLSALGAKLAIVDASTTPTRRRGKARPAGA